MASAGDVIENPVTGQRIVFEATARETDGELLGGRSGDYVVAGTGPGAYALVERVRSEIRAARPRNRASFCVDLDVREALGCASRFEHGAAHPLEDVDLALESVGEREAQHAVADGALPWLCRASSRSSQGLHLLKCFTSTGTAPVLRELVLVELSPGEHEP